jgi:hypothetical protein
MNTPKLEEMIAFVAAETSIPQGKISASSRLYHDLGICGDDADELMQLFAKRFSVDMSAFEFHEYFEDEPSLLDWLRLFRKAAQRLSRRRALGGPRPVTIADMVRCAEEGRWTDRSSSERGKC